MPKPLNPSTKHTPWYKNYMVTVFVIGLPAFVVVACIFFIVFAVKIKDTTVRDDWYMDGKTLYQDASKDQMAYDLGLHGVMRFEGENVSFELYQEKQTQNFTQPATLAVTISHATDKSKDRDFLLTRTKDNLYHGKTTIDKLPAKYYLHVVNDEQKWRLVHTQRLPAQNIVFSPLSAFDQTNQSLPDQRHKRSQQPLQ